VVAWAKTLATVTAMQNSLSPLGGIQKTGASKPAAKTVTPRFGFA